MNEIDIADDIESNTQDQANNISWYNYHMKRLTASRFGEICKAQANNRKINLVKELIQAKESNSQTISIQPLK